MEESRVNEGHGGDLAVGDLNVAFSFVMVKISQRRLSLALGDPPPCVSPCSLIRGSESTQISRSISWLSSPSSRLTGVSAGATIAMALPKN